MASASIVSGTIQRLSIDTQQYSKIYFKANTNRTFYKNAIQITVWKRQMYNLPKVLTLIKFAYYFPRVRVRKNNTKKKG